MKMKTKVSLTILPVLLLGIVAINIGFGLFFQNFILESEDDKIRVSADYISTYLSEKSNNYLGSVNDWAHWDDTYKFIGNLDEKYKQLNLTGDTMQSLDINFMIFLNNSNLIIHKLYYSFDDEAMSEFPSDFLQSIDNASDLALRSSDTSGIIKIGDNYYFVASSVITDSLQNETATGTLIIGKLIDHNVIEQMEKSSGMSVSAISGVTDPPLFNEIDSTNHIKIDYVNIEKDSVGIKLLVPNTYDLDSSIVLSLVMKRELYLSGMKQAQKFAFINTLGSIVIAFVIFVFLGNFITKPFMSLINDVKSIDVTNIMTHKISEKGKDEFYFLRHSINTLLNKLSVSQHELIENREELQTTLLSIGEGIITVGNEGRIKFMNPMAQKITGWRLEESLNVPLDLVLSMKSVSNGDIIENPVEAVFKSKGIIKVSNDISIVSKNGSFLEIEITAAPLKNQYEEMVGCVLAINDITEARMKQRHIEYLSYRDILTGLYNRYFYEEKLKEFQTKEKSLVSIIIIDVNGLKLTNDAFGHETGDRLLIKMADCIKRSVRNEDVVCRIGGDEFVVLLLDTDSNEAMCINANIHTVVEKEKIENIPISVSTGWATKKHMNDSIDFVFKQAEDMMYHNKSSDNKSQRHQTIQIIMKTLFEKNPREEAHSKRVSEICYQIGLKMGMDSSRVKNLQTAGLLHDIGKIGIGNNYLDKEGSLNDEEWIEVKKHPQISHNILCSVNDYGPLAEIVLSHHERWDGRGYPSGLVGDKIPLESRIIALADAFDAIVSDRPYRKGLIEAKALEIISSESGKQFDPDLVSIFLEMVMPEYNS